MARVHGAAKLLFLHPAFRAAVDYLLAQVDFPVTITSGFRSIEDQRRVCAELKEKERRTGRHFPCATPGLSAHQWGLAVDMMGGSSFASAEHRDLRLLAAQLGFAFVPDDPPHFEHPAWRQIRPQVRRYLGLG